MFVYEVYIFFQYSCWHVYCLGIKPCYCVFCSYFCCGCFCYLLGWRWGCQEITVIGKKANTESLFDITIYGFAWWRRLMWACRSVYPIKNKVNNPKRKRLTLQRWWPGVTNKSPEQLKRSRKNYVKNSKHSDSNQCKSKYIKVIYILDVTFDLNNKAYKPYLKPGNTNCYVNI